MVTIFNLEFLPSVAERENGITNSRHSLDLAQTGKKKKLNRQKNHKDQLSMELICNLTLNRQKASSFKTRMNGFLAYLCHKVRGLESVSFQASLFRAR